MSRRRAAEALEAANRHLETSVQERTRELALANVDLQQEIAEREQVQQALERAKQAAESANLSKSEFLANMSHEIRTPMTAILGFADLLLEQNDTEAQTSKRIDAITTIKRNGEHLLTIINDILDLSKIEAGRISVEQVWCSLRQILSDVVSLIEVRADAKGLAFRIELEGIVPDAIQTDPLRLRQILVNVIANAVKFTEKGEVRVVARFVRDNHPRSGVDPTAANNTMPAEDCEPHLQFDVHDTGIGIDANQCAKLFAPFSQADSSTTRKHGGTGLGLVISRHFAHLLGGDRDADSLGTRIRKPLSH